MFSTIFSREVSSFLSKRTHVLSKRYYSAAITHHARQLDITLPIENNKGKTTYSLPYFWLRDHCRCPSCYHSVTRQRLVNTFGLDRDIRPSSVTWEDGLHVVWPDGHKSHYAHDWISTHGHQINEQVWKDALAPTEQQRLWQADTLLSSSLTDRLTFEQVMETKQGVTEWLHRLERDGIAFVEDVPTTLEATETLARRLCFLRETHYSKGMWSFTADLAHADTAYTQLALGAHTDNTYFTEPSGLQMFHKLEFQGQGGDSLFVDGFAVAEQLKIKDPEAYATLTTTRIPTHSAGDENVLIVPTPRAYPILNHDPLTGDLYQIRYNNDDRSTLNHLSPTELDRFYDALFSWQKLLTDKTNEYWDPLPPGRVVTFDNWRVLHGRSAFTGHRRICGAYFPWDDYKSRARTLRLSTNEKNRVL
ncbi:trimethyllysine dioxygenase [Halteromyces radiatus]|uniref:trimethyllysine dioxygenase n=1 Tax=Halteromyces radiatus TaxID=101107 RepID=UPI00221FD422|nr:trimethyllysine dioxygenase [Halteromyces radiatus]KAI8099141.1 trimethyllysine dioxygenase [Halteromyces radiatus]